MSGLLGQESVSIVIPTFKRGAWLRELISRCRALEGIECHATEIVVVDNCPHGSARDVVRAAALQGGTPVRYVWERRPGISHARNAGIDAARGSLIAFVDDDELPDKNWLANLVRTLHDADADVVFGPVMPVFEREPSDHARFIADTMSYRPQAPIPTGTRLLPRAHVVSRRGDRQAAPFLSGNCLMRRRSCLATPDPFRSDLGLTGGEDTLFFTELALSGRRLVWCNEAVVSERVPAERANLDYLFRRGFRFGQATTRTCLLLAPPRRLQALTWMAVGCGQVALFGLLLALRAFSASGRRPAARLKLMEGLGKVLWMKPFRRRWYGAAAVE